MPSKLLLLFVLADSAFASACTSPETCSDTEVLLQARTQVERVEKLKSRTATIAMLSDSGQQDPESDTLTEYAGVPVYNYHLRIGVDDANHKTYLRLLHSDMVSVWLVMLNGILTDAEVHELCSNLPGDAKCHFEGHPMEGGIPAMSFQGTTSELKRFLDTHASKVFSVEADTEMVADELPWGLDRIDARAGTDGVYETAANGGEGVHVYVVDSGIRTTHMDFRLSNGTSRAIPTLDLTSGHIIECGSSDVSCAADMLGHGTHVAGTVGGLEHGVAKGVTLHAVKVLGYPDDPGARSGKFEWYVFALDWIATHAQQPAIVSMSINRNSCCSDLFNASVYALAEKNITLVVSAGNGNTDACWETMARPPPSIAVGAIDKDGRRPGFSNYGSCVDIFAPGVKILSALHDSDTSTGEKTGTSMACPHVSGAAALLLQRDAKLTPAEVKQKLQASATINVIQDVIDAEGTRHESPSLLLYVGNDTTAQVPIKLPLRPVKIIHSGQCSDDMGHGLGGWRRATRDECMEAAQHFRSMLKAKHFAHPWKKEDISGKRGSERAAGCLWNPKWKVRFNNVTSSTKSCGSRDRSCICVLG